MKIILPVVAVLIILFAPPLFSQEKNGLISAPQTAGESFSETVVSIEVIGLKRTKLHVAKYPLEKFLGQKRSEINENDVIAAVKDTGVIEPVSAEFVDTGAGFILRVTVEEKWSIFPFPFVYAGSNGESNFGLFFCDFNAFGLRDMAVFGGTYGSNGWSAFLMYNNTPDRGGIPGWTIVALFNQKDNEDVDRHENTIRAYTADSLRASFGLNYTFKEIFTTSFTFSFSGIFLEDNDVLLNNLPGKEAVYIGFNPGISVRSSDWDGFFLSNQSVSFDYTYNLAISGSSFHQIEFRGNYEKSIFPGFRTVLKGGASWKSTNDSLFEDGQNKAQVNILPKNYSAFYYTGLSAGLEKYLVKFKWGTLSVLGSWQCVFSGGDITGLKFDHGPSGGFLIYLSRVALPAIGTGLSYNMVSGLYQFSFSVGMSF